MVERRKEERGSRERRERRKTRRRREGMTHKSSNSVKEKKLHPQSTNTNMTGTSTSQAQSTSKQQKDREHKSNKGIRPAVTNAEILDVFRRSTVFKYLHEK